jgi:AcrR family transcriptional regulator
MSRAKVETSVDPTADVQQGVMMTVHEKQQSDSRVPLNRERVLRAALALADSRGVESLTMRELARELGVQAMSLYNHVANKDDVLDGMVDLILEEVELPADEPDWKQAMRRRAVSAHSVFASHPWASALVDSRESSGPARLRYFDWVVGTLRRAGFSLAQTAQAFSLLDSYIYGFGRQQLNMSADGDVDPEQMAQAFMAAIPADEYPYLTELVVEHALKHGYDADEDFEFGLQLILGGLERVLHGE